MHSRQKKQPRSGTRPTNRLDRLADGDYRVAVVAAVARRRDLSAWALLFFPLCCSSFVPAADNHDHRRVRLRLHERRRCLAGLPLDGRRRWTWKAGRPQATQTRRCRRGGEPGLHGLSEREAWEGTERGNCCGGDTNTQWRRRAGVALGKERSDDTCIGEPKG